MDNKEKEEVDMIASGYEWICPECETFHQVIEIPKVEEVTCKKCQEQFKIGEPFHARG